MKDIIEQMQKNYEAEDRGITITELDGAYQMCTKPQMYDYLIKVAKRPKALRTDRRIVRDAFNYRI